MSCLVAAAHIVPVMILKFKNYTISLIKTRAKKQFETQFLPE